jgi:Flp pilus assembly protein TadG
MGGIQNERGSVLIFATLAIVLLLIMVGMGLDTGQLSYVRSQGQAAVDAAALAAVSGLPQSQAEVEKRAAAFNSTNDYVESPTNKIGSSNISYIQYDFTKNQITNYSATFDTANGVRVALEQATGSGITTPVFLTPLLNVLGFSTSGSKDIAVSSVAVTTAKPSIPIALWEEVCQGSSTVSGVKIRQQPPGSENSCWTTYLDKSSGANDIRELFQVSAECSGAPTGPIDIGVHIYENKGQAATIYDDAHQLFMQDHPGRCWMIPVITGTGNCNAKNPTPIRDWAKICPTEVSKNGAHSYITANVTCNQKIQGDTKNSLCFSNRLVRDAKSGM